MFRALIEVYSKLNTLAIDLSTSIGLSPFLKIWFILIQQLRSLFNFFHVDKMSKLAKSLVVTSLFCQTLRFSRRCWNLQLQLPSLRLMSPPSCTTLTLIFMSRCALRGSLAMSKFASCFKILYCDLILVFFSHIVIPFHLQRSIHCPSPRISLSLRRKCSYGILLTTDCCHDTLRLKPMPWFPCLCLLLVEVPFIMILQLEVILMMRH